MDVLRSSHVTHTCASPHSQGGPYCTQGVVSVLRASQPCDLQHLQGCLPHQHLPESEPWHPGSSSAMQAPRKLHPQDGWQLSMSKGVAYLVTEQARDTQAGAVQVESDGAPEIHQNHHTDRLR